VNDLTIQISKNGSQKTFTPNSGSAAELEVATKNPAVPLCFIINTDFRSIGGSRTRFRAEVNYFSSKGYDVTVVYSSDEKEMFFRKDKVDYFNIRHIRRLIFVYQVRLFFRCLRLCASKKRLIFIAHEPISLIPPALICHLRLRARTTLVMHGPSAIETYLRGNKTLATILSVTDRVAFMLAQRIVAVSEYERDYAVALKADPGKITIIRNGIDFPKLSDPAPFEQEMGIPPDKITVGYLGTVAPYRGTEFLVKAFPLARTLTRTPLALVLVYREELTEAHKRKIKDLAVPYDQDVYISKPIGDVSRVLPAIDIYASHFSRKVDGIGFSIVEAMASGLPVITGKDNITNRLLEDGVDAILVNKENAKEIADAIARLAEDPLLRKTIGANAQKTAAIRFSMAHMLTLLEKEYLGEAPG
jgi:glycosyltransferase involved in cell wall biosynthesis